MGEMGDKVEGEVKDAGGKVTGDKKMEWEGKAQKVKGDLEGAGNDATNNDPVEGDKNL